jgi:hypothetical protein
MRLNAFVAEYSVLRRDEKISGHIPSPRARPCDIFTITLVEEVGPVVRKTAPGLFLANTGKNAE